MRLLYWWVTSLCLAIAAPVSRADVLLYDYVQTSLIGTNYNAEAFADNRTKMAQRFITQVNGFVLTQLKLNIWTGSPNSGTYTVDIYSDNSNAVGTKVATAGTRDISTIYAPSGTLTQATLSNLNIRLSTNTSYWLYLAHLPLVIALQALVCDWPWPAWAKFLFMLSVSTILLLLSFQLLVRDKPLGWLLNGRKTPPLQPKPPSA